VIHAPAIKYLLIDGMGNPNTCDEYKSALEKYIKYYNERRIKEKLGWLSPVAFRFNPAA